MELVRKKGKSLRIERSRKSGVPKLRLFFILFLLLVSIFIAWGIKNKREDGRGFGVASGALAFPGAVGYGKNTRGGWGGRVIYVTNVQDSGPGSLRDALEAIGPRIVIINTSGTVLLNSDIQITSPNISIYGNKAPGAGLQIRHNMINIKTHDVIIRYLRVRVGDEGVSQNFGERDAVTTTCSSGTDRNPHDIIIDHSSLVWGTDIGGFAATCAAYYVTLSYNIMGEGIVNGGHPKGPHSKGMNLSNDQGDGPTKDFTIYKNLITSSEARMPQIRDGGRTDFINNVIYNWGNVAGEGSSTGLNMIGNTWKKGGSSTGPCAFAANPFDPATNGPIYASGESLDTGMTQFCGSITANPVPYSLSLALTDISPAQIAYNELILSRNVGAIKPVIDPVDARIIDNVKNRTGSLIVDTPNEVGGWPYLFAGAPISDSDLDGLPDTWETQMGLTDANGDPDSDGYTNVEEYLNDSDPRVFTGSGANSPTVTPGGNPTATPPTTPFISISVNPSPVCDLCGWCYPDIYPTPPPEWERCKSCLYDQYGAPRPGYSYTIAGCLPTAPARFAQSVLSIIVGAIGGISFLAFIYGAFVLMTSRGNKERIIQGREIITSSIVGVLLVLFAVFIVKIIGADILRIPGF